MNKNTRKKINKEIEHLNDTVDQWDLTDISSTQYSTAAESEFF